MKCLTLNLVGEIGPEKHLHLVPDHRTATA